MYTILNDIIKKARKNLLSIFYSNKINVKSDQIYISIKFLIFKNLLIFGFLFESVSVRYMYFSKNIRGRSDKSLTARRRHYRKINILSCSTFSQTAIVKISVESDSQFYFDRVWKRASSRILKNGKRAISIGDSILVFRREIAQRSQRPLGCCVR